MKSSSQGKDRDRRARDPHPLSLDRPKTVLRRSNSGSRHRGIIGDRKGSRELYGDDDSRRGPIFGPIPKATRRPNRVSKYTLRNNRFFANIREIDQRNLIRTTMSHESADGEECDACDSTNNRNQTAELDIKDALHWCERRSAKLRSISRAIATLRDTMVVGCSENSSCATVIEELSGRSESSNPPIVRELIFQSSLVSIERRSSGKTHFLYDFPKEGLIERPDAL